MLREFLGGQNIFVNLPTGYGKSDFPVPSDRCGCSVFFCSAVAIAYGRPDLNLNALGVPAIAITDEEDVEIIQQVTNGNCVLVYGSPECLFSTESWRSIFFF